MCPQPGTHQQRRARVEREPARRIVRVDRRQIRREQRANGGIEACGAQPTDAVAPLARAVRFRAGQVGEAGARVRIDDPERRGLDAQVHDHPRKDRVLDDLGEISGVKGVAIVHDEGREVLPGARPQWTTWRQTTGSANENADGPPETSAEASGGLEAETNAPYDLVATPSGDVPGAGVPVRSPVSGRFDPRSGGITSLSRRQDRRLVSAHSRNARSRLRQMRTSRSRFWSQPTAIAPGVSPGLALLKASSTSAGVTVSSSLTSRNCGGIFTTAPALRTVSKNARAGRPEQVP